MSTVEHTVDEMWIHPAQDDPNQVILFDTTLRDGEQTPGVSFDQAEKYEIAEHLAEAGIDVIEAGFPVASKGDFDAVQAIASGIGKEDGPIIAGLSRTGRADMDRAMEALDPAARKRLHVFIATSEVHMQHKLRMSPEQVRNEAAEAVRYAREEGGYEDIEFSPEDASRSDFEFMVSVLQAAVDNGATTINIPDTVGYAIPEEWASRIRKIRERVVGNYIISTHCHDDLGMAVANSLAAVAAGARQVEGAFNGIGERAGNAAMEEVAAGIVARQDYFKADGAPLYTAIDTRLLPQVSRVVSRVSGVRVPINKAIVGGNAFRHSSGIHQHGTLSERTTYEHMNPADFGQASQIVIDKLSGTHGLRHRAAALGFDETRINSNHRRAMDEWCDRNNRAAEDSDIEYVIHAVDGIEYVDHIGVHARHIESSNGTYTADVSFVFNGAAIQEVSAKGNGGLDAMVRAAKKIVGPDFNMELEPLEASGSGSDATALARVTVTDGKRAVTAFGEHTSMEDAAFSAYLAGVNTLIRTNDRHEQKEAVDSEAE